ncbi:MAG: Zn-ribbon containing protein [Candidatus Micrarchaeia archaeon]|jgi:predicted  nucleic acid-binding Zn-ribbon protein
MPHKCVSCSKIYPNSSPELLKGCSCGSRIFLFLKNEDITIKQAMDSGLSAVMSSGKVLELSARQPVSVELVDPEEDGEADADEIRNYIGTQQPAFGKKEQPAENITVIDKGEYELDIDSIMRGDPLVVRSQNGIYYLKIPSIRHGK